MAPGETYGRLTVELLLPAGLAMTRCDCGKRRAVRRSSLAAGLTRSCGCLAKEKSAERLRAQLTKHGHAAGSGTPEYIAWVNAKARVTNPNHPRFKTYGARGIGMSPTWAKDFSAFLEDMGEKPDPSLSLDRIDVDGDYVPENCRWTTDAIQRANRQRRPSATSAPTGQEPPR
jgi:hypothetical protein